jgi:hypothetical protein
MTTQQERQRILDVARATLRSNGIHTNTIDGDALAAWSALKKSREEPEPPVSANPEPAPVDWAAWETWVQTRIDAAIEREREWLINELLPEIVAAVQNEASVELSMDVSRLNCELAELRALIGEAQAMLRADRAARGIPGPVIDVPKPATPVN